MTTEELKRPRKVINLKKSKKTGIVIGTCPTCKATVSNCNEENITKCICCERILDWEL